MNIPILTKSVTTDLVVTVPLAFGLDQWIAEGDPAGAPWSGEEWDFYLGMNQPKTEPGARVYVVYNKKLRGYAPLVRVDKHYLSHGRYTYSLVRHGGAVAVTIDQPIVGFRGFRYRWWNREEEYHFPGWMQP